VSYRKDVHSGNQPRYVARITLVKGIPFYGFHVGYRFFLKIYMSNPIVMTRLADLLHQGVIMGRKFQPYEAHLQYLLQFMTDYNLYGCDYVEANKAFFRSPVPDYDEDDHSPHRWHLGTIPPEKITDDFRLPRASHCSIEVDICVHDILNRKAVKERRLHHDFVERLKPLPSDMKLVHSMAGLWRDETKRRKRQLGITDPSGSPFPPDVLVSMSADPRDSQPQGWIHEDEFRAQVQDLIAQEVGDRPEDTPPTFESFTRPHPMEATVKTVLQSVEDLYPDNLLPVIGLFEDYEEKDDSNPDSSIEIDEKNIVHTLDPDVVDELFVDAADEEIIREVERAEKTYQESLIRKELSLVSKRRPLPPIDGLVGVCQSGLRTGRPSVMPLHSELIMAAKAEGLVSRPPEAVVAQDLQTSRLKRTLSTASTSASKRQKPVEPPIKKDSPLSASQQSKSSANASSSKKNNQTLSFAVVKDPNDPSTKLRLSQQSSSQNSEDLASKKQVSFGPPSPLTEKDPSGSLKISKSLASSSSLTPTPNTDTSSYGISGTFSTATQTNVWVMSETPPSATEVTASMQDYGIPDVIYQDAFYSKEKDVPSRTREYAGREFRLESNTLPFLPDFDPTGQTRQRALSTKRELGSARSRLEQQYKSQRRHCTLRSWEIAEPPPTFNEVDTWWQEKQSRARKARTSSSSQAHASSQSQRPYMSQIDGPTPRNKHGFKYSQKQRSTSVQHEVAYMSTMSLEVHVNTRGKLVPNPEEDEVQCIFWCLKSDENDADSSQSPDMTESGIIVLSENGSLAERVRRQTPTAVLEESSELDLMVRMVEVVRSHDPDVLTGYEVHGGSWGYLIERARFKYDYNLCDEFSRMKSQSHGRFGKEEDRWGFNTTSTIRVTGRHMINIWRAMRGELNLLQYTLENVVWHLLHRRVPHYSWRTLTDWYKSGRPHDLSKVLRYYQSRTRLDIEILEGNELIPRTSEQARLLGVDFFSVFSRGSQFKVESIMFRIAKPENFLLVSPSKKQVGGQNALECLPLVMEPQSAFYSSPLLVLDFQSLYPSVMIAFNYCYSTFLGRIVDWRGANKMGFTEYKRRERLLGLLKDYINIAPNGMMYVKAEIRKSLLAKMLTEILETRIMVKSGMKQDKDDRRLQQLLNNRQLALKLLANVTYGYASASFSGRMPCSEIADSIVQTARETLERAVAYIHSVERWGAEVVYGDTDSLFVYLKGRTRDQAFDIGNEIAKAVSDMNPRPVKLKFEKVYHPCVLLAKKRYVGYKYESRDQAAPEFDAKGIETVRRDGTPAEQKMEEKALRLLFETADLSRVKAYFQAQCGKIMRGAVSVQDFCFAKEVRLGSYSGKGPPPPGALISTRRMMEDARAEPQYGERVPYVVVTGAPGARLVDRCVAPDDLLRNTHLSLDAEYYIGKNLIPPLDRIFNLVGASVRSWYDEMPKVQRVRRIEAPPSKPSSTASATAINPFSLAAKRGAAAAPKKVTLESYLQRASCVVCGVRMRTGRVPGGGRGGGRGGGSSRRRIENLCGRCSRHAPATMAALLGRLRVEEDKYAAVEQTCRSCAGLAPADEVKCDSGDCPVFYTRVKQATRLRSEKAIVDPIVKALTARDELEW